MSQMARVTVDDLMRWSPQRSHFDAEEIRQHPTYDSESDTIEVFRSHLDVILINRALSQWTAASTITVREAIKAFDRLSASCNAAASQVARQLEEARRPSGQEGQE